METFCSVKEMVKTKKTGHKLGETLANHLSSKGLKSSLRFLITLKTW